MKKHIKLVVFFLSLLIVFGTYKIFSKNLDKINYIALGDSIAEGMNSYGVIDYGYSDYISDYLNKNNRLDFYTKKFSKSGYTTRDVINDIENNKSVTINNKKVYLKEILRESNLVTLTIGANNFIKSFSLNYIEEMLKDIPKSKKEIDNVGKEIEEVIILLKKYAKGKIIVTGYYNPFPSLSRYKDELDNLIKYFNNIIEDICDEYDIIYVNIFDIFDKNSEYLPNTFNIHPSKKGYEEIAKKIIKSIE